MLSEKFNPVKGRLYVVSQGEVFHASYAFTELIATFHKSCHIKLFFGLAVFLGKNMKSCENKKQSLVAHCCEKDAYCPQTLSPKVAEQKEFNKSIRFYQSYFTQYIKRFLHYFLQMISVKT